MFEPQELSNLMTFLNRVDIKGAEAIPMAELQKKIQLAIDNLPIAVEADKPK